MNAADRQQGAGGALDGTVESWAHELITTCSLAAKLAPPEPPRSWREAPQPLRIERPGRAPELRVVQRAPKSPRPAALGDPRARARLVHTFWHHEVQAAELFLWALLAFPRTPRAFRRGLLALAREELRHAALYAGHLESLGFRPGSFEVRDWFWQRVPTVEDEVGFVALVGLGLEAGNLEHAARYATAFAAAGDSAGARLIQAIGADEVAHVRFSRRWFQRWRGALTFDAWRRELPGPLTPSVLRGRPLNKAARRAAGLDESFLLSLEAWDPPRSQS